MSGALLVCGTHSDAGKSLVTAGICRWLRRQGVRVAPFKAQNMALNSVVAPDGSEIGRAQAMQAAAAGVEPEAAMNPVLIKPSGARHSQVVVMGRPYADVGARSYQALKDRAARRSCSRRSPACASATTSSSARAPAAPPRSTCASTTSPTWASPAPPVSRSLLVGDIDRGGVFASLYGTLALLEPDDQAHIAGFVSTSSAATRRSSRPGSSG